MSSDNGEKTIVKALVDLIQPDLDDIINRRQEEFIQLVKAQVEEIEVLKSFKVHEFDMPNEILDGILKTDSEENDAEKRIRENLDLVNKLKKELDNLHLERLLDSSRVKILRGLEIESWQRLKEKAAESGMTPHDYIFASLKEKPIENGEHLPVESIKFLCTKSFIDIGNLRNLEEAYISVYGQGVGQSA